jgi:hypothetical protein
MCQHHFRSPPHVATGLLRISFVGKATVYSKESLSLEEDELRAKFGATTRAGDVVRRDEVWPKLGQARLRAAQNKRSLYVRVRLGENRASALASCLVRDLKRITWVRNPRGKMYPPVIHADAPCNLLFEMGNLPPCDRGPNHPHDVGGYADDLDNETEFTQPAMKKLRNLAGPQPKA